MASDVTICNLALSHLGDDRINDLNDPTRQGRACKLHYAAARDAVLRDHPWNFATSREYLALLSGVTPVGWSYAYAYPSECLFAREIWQDTPQLEPTPFAVMRIGSQRVVATNEADAALEYTALVSDPTQFDALFIDALGYKLAAELAMPLTRSVPITQAMLSLYMSRMAQATTIDSREGRKDPDHPNGFIQARL